MQKNKVHLSEVKIISSGAYLLCIKVDRSHKILIGKLGLIQFQEGCYHYIGSAMNNQLQNRVLRHLKPPEMKKLHWHIDFLLQSIHAEIAKIVLFPSNRKEECEIAAQIRAQMIEVVPNFGSSDCKCESHLFFSGKKLPF